MLSLIGSFLLDKSGNNDDVNKLLAMPCDQKRSELKIFRLEKLGFEDGKTDLSLVLNKCRLSFPMDFHATNFEECIAVKERESAVDVPQLQSSVQVAQFDLSYPLLADEHVRSSNEWTRLVSFMDPNMVKFMGLAIVFDFQFILAFCFTAGPSYCCRNIGSKPWCDCLKNLFTLVLSLRSSKI